LRRLGLRALLAVTACGALALPASAVAQEPASPSAGTPPEHATVVADNIEVTATRLPEDVEMVPASITIIPGADIEARGARDLQGALALAGGVSIAPGGDGGPAGSVPEIWGLREFDAFLLVVDGVPWGGAFNPALPTLDLTNVERIEVLRGAAPVMYGATSFVGVIHVIHRAAGAGGRFAQLFGGNYGSFGAAFSTPLSGSDRFKQSLTVNGERRGFKDDDTGFDKGHVLYRSSYATEGGGSFRFDLDGSVVNQSPASPHPRTGTVLTPLVPLDANHNPSDAKIDEDRFHLVGGFDRKLGGAAWSTTLSFTHGKRDTIRGFLAEISNTDENAVGFTQDLSVTDAYFDTHLAWELASGFRLVAGLDHIYGKAKADSETFFYRVNLDGSGRDSSGSVDREMGFDSETQRNFSGLYGQAEWNPTERLHLQLGLRVNRTAEEREAGERELGEGDGGEEEGGKVDKTRTNLSGVVGASFLAWSNNSDGVWLFADYRDTFKPAAIDFGPESEAEILDPETAKSYEVGIKTRLARCEWELTAFQMDFENLVTAATVDGLPTLINSGQERFKGIELEGRVKLAQDLSGQFSYAWHDSKFRDFVQEFDGVPTQLAGNRLEMVARNIGSAGLIYSPAEGLSGFVLANYVGDRFLNKRNTALAKAYTTWSAGLGYRFANWQVRLDGENLNDDRSPVAESELGDAQYYRLPARSLRLTVAKSF
jgi:outer membrane receptor protein involved in Fe transport